MVKSGIAFDDIKSREDAKDYLFSAPVIDRTRELYIKRNLSARQTIEEMSLSQWYEGNKGYFARAFSYHLPKDGVGRGGARPNAGRPVGSRICTGCGQLRASCTCPKGKPDADYRVLSVITRPAEEGGAYSAMVAVESRAGYYRVYERKVDRYPTHADITRTAHSGEPVEPQRARRYFDQQLTHKHEEGEED